MIHCFKINQECLKPLSFFYSFLLNEPDLVLSLVMQYSSHLPQTAMDHALSSSLGCRIFKIPLVSILALFVDLSAEFCRSLDAL